MVAEVTEAISVIRLGVDLVRIFFLLFVDFERKRKLAAKYSIDRSFYNILSAA